MVSRCNACKHGAVNLSKKYECWRFNREKEDGDLFHSKMREDHAETYTKHGLCLYFESKEIEEADTEKKVTVKKIYICNVEWEK